MQGELRRSMSILLDKILVPPIGVILILVLGRGRLLYVGRRRLAGALLIFRLVYLWMFSTRPTAQLFGLARRPKDRPATVDGVEHPLFVELRWSCACQNVLRNFRL